MGKANIGYHSLRLNLNNEQHQRVHKVLMDLNTDVHKSVNQFLADAADAYITSLEGGLLTGSDVKCNQKNDVSRSDLNEIRREIKEEVSDEIVRVLGLFFAGGQAIKKVGVLAPEQQNVAETEEDATMMDLATKWG